MLFHTIPWYPMPLYCMLFHFYSTQFHDIPAIILYAVPCCSTILHDIPCHYIVWYSMLFHTIPWYPMPLYCMLFHVIPHTSMISQAIILYAVPCCSTILHDIPCHYIVCYYMLFHATPWYPMPLYFIAVPCCSARFQDIPAIILYVIPWCSTLFHDIPCHYIVCYSIINSRYSTTSHAIVDAHCLILRSHSYILRIIRITQIPYFSIHLGDCLNRNHFVHVPDDNQSIGSSSGKIFSIISHTDTLARSLMAVQLFKLFRF